MASVSGASSGLGNTSLRGYGGFASGIDRDSIIEKMTSGTTAKITKQKNAMTTMSWKQESYQSVIDKMLSMQDNYMSFTSGTNLKYSSAFAKNMITAMGDPDVTKFVTATGTSNMTDYLSIKGVKQLATSATRLSDAKGSSGPIKTGINNVDDPLYKASSLKGKELKFGTYASDGSFQNAGTFTFPSTYKDIQMDADGNPVLDENGNPKEITKDIDYLADPATLVGQLNKALSDFKLGENGKIQFSYDGGTDKISITATGDAQNYVIRETSTALSALGIVDDGLQSGNGITISGSNNEFNNLAQGVTPTYVHDVRMKDYLVGKNLSVTFGGQTKKVNLLESTDVVNSLDDLAGIMQKRLDRAFGTGKIEVGKDTTSGNLVFKTVDPSQTLTITSDDAELRSTIGIDKNASNKLSMDSSLWANRDKLGLKKDDGTSYADGEEDSFNTALANFKINGVSVTGLTANTTVNGMIDKINSTKDIGVKASYLSAENQFVLVATESGTGRKIELDGAADAMFGSTSAANNKDGQDALITVSYGNGVESTITSASNTFNLEGLKVTVTNTFGYKVDEHGNTTNDLDPSQAVTFNAKADAEGVTETVKKFFEDYNELVKEINEQITTKPDKSYGPLTDEQKEEMTDKSIENWEKKAKQGLLFNDPTMQAVSTSIQSILTNLMGNGVDYTDLEEIGITISDDYKDGGAITFDENKFKDAMTSKPELVSDIFTGGGDVKKGFMNVLEDTLTPYATRYSGRNGNSYGRLVEEAGSEKLPNSITSNQIYRQLQDMQANIDKLNAQLKSEQDRYISKFTTMETLINQMNAQASYLTNLQG